jgi:hypothetical protein
MLKKFYGKVQCSQDNPVVFLKEIKEIIEREKQTWAEQSIGWKAVESVEKALGIEYSSK